MDGRDAIVIEEIESLNCWGLIYKTDSCKERRRGEEVVVRTGIEGGGRDISGSKRSGHHGIGGQMTEAFGCSQR